MAVYTVHEPPLREADASSDPERFAFVRDGFAGWAFLLAPLWMLWHEMWLVLFGYIVVLGGLEALVRALGASPAVMVFIGFLVSLLIGLEASTLRRFTLSRRGWRQLGIVSGDDGEEAERRFFDAWLAEPAPSAESAEARSATPPPIPAVPSAPGLPQAPRVPQAPGVIGLFPEPGTNR